MTREREIVTLEIEHDEGVPVAEWDWQRFVSDDATRIKVLGVVKDDEIDLSNYRARIEHDLDGVDIGDWLPQDREHYERVGPFSLCFCKVCDALAEVTEWDTSVSPNKPVTAKHLHQHSTRECHCGKRRGSSDHCDFCGCEEYERNCTSVWPRPHTAEPEFRDVGWSEWWERDEAKVENWSSFGMILEHRCADGHWHDTGQALWGLDFLTNDPKAPTDDTYTYDELPDDYLKEVMRDLAYEYQARKK